MSYFVVTSGEDGTKIEKITKEELLRRITPNEHGETDYGYNIDFLNKVPYEDKGFWREIADNSILIIKGEIVIPKEVMIVKEYKLE